jgi:DNA topoisomerase IA
MGNARALPLALPPDADVLVGATVTRLLAEMVAQAGDVDWSTLSLVVAKDPRFDALVVRAEFEAES